MITSIGSSSAGLPVNAYLATALAFCSLRLITGSDSASVYLAGGFRLQNYLEGSLRLLPEHSGRGKHHPCRDRKRLAKGQRKDYLQKYAIRSPDGTDLWFAHFHYPALETPVEG